MSSTNPLGPTPTMPEGPPYFPTTAALGGQPTTDLDDPICGVLLLFFLAGAVTHMTILQVNLRKGHKFFFSGALFGFCMARTVALVMRITWASRPTNINVAIAANIFTAAGVIIIFIVNLVFTQRLVRAYHPSVGWHPAVKRCFRALYLCVIALLIMVITVVVQSFFTLDGNIRRIDRDIQLFAVTFLAVMAFMPIPIITIAALVPRSNRVEKFGQGRFRTKVAMLVFSSALMTLGAGFRAGVAYEVRPRTDPAWYHHKACFYVLNFGIELVVVYMYAIARFDRRFHVPDGSSGPGDYAGGQLRTGKQHNSLAMSERINKEEDVFGASQGRSDSEAGPSSGRQTMEWETRARDELQQGLDAPRQEA